MWLRIGKSGGVCKSGDEHLGLIKCWEIFDYLRTISFSRRTMSMECFFVRVGALIGL